MHLYLEIFLIGLFGSMHCIGMCGGFVAMYSLKNSGSGPSLLQHLLYNLGRTTTYVLLGGILGYIGSFSAYLSSYKAVPGTVLLAAGGIMVLMALHMLGVLGRRGLLETDMLTSLPLFRSILHTVLGMRTTWSVYLFGVLLGFLPCGLLYPVFIQAAVSGGFYSGLLMLVLFGLGTMPALMAFGLIVTRIKPLLRLAFYRVASGLILLLGVQNILRGMAFIGWISPSRFW